MTIYYIRKGISIYKYIDSIFIYSASKNEFFFASNGKMTAEENSRISEYIKNKIINLRNNEVTASIGWHVESIGDEFYLLAIYSNRDMYVGSWVKTSTLLKPLNEAHFAGNSISMFITSDGRPMDHLELVQENNVELDRDIQQFYITGDHHRFMIIGAKSDEGDFSMVTLTPLRKIMTGFPYIRHIIILIIIVTVIFLPIYLLILRKTVISPLNSVITAMKGIRNGDLNIRIKPFKTSEEFNIVNTTFNDMLTQINKLKIDIYEEKISRQKAELEHLQLQAKPHFFLNSLNIMNTLARTRNYILLQEMCTCLVEYFRYMFRSNTPYISLNDELKHVKNYLRIQELRFPDKFSYEIDVPEYLLNLLIPPLLIHTFVENTVKHALTINVTVNLLIRACLETECPEPRVKLFIQDTGRGFKEEILTKLQSGEKIIDQQGEHIGIWNVRQRLGMLYNDKAEINFENSITGGATIKISIPFNQHDIKGKE